jgi:hypothetical protein
VPALLEYDGRVNGSALALWAWNIYTGRWDVVTSQIPCKDLQTCYMYPTGAAVAIGANGKAAGTWFWISAEVNADQNGALTQAYYRIYIPAT